jgi:hypothetical protein
VGIENSIKDKKNIWQMYHDRLADQLKKRECQGDSNCQLCGQYEDLNHIMFRCACSVFVWATIKETFEWDRYPCSLEDFLTNWMGSKSGSMSRMLLFGLGVVCSALWKV